MLTFPKPFPRVLSRRALLVNDYSEIFDTPPCFSCGECQAPQAPTRRATSGTNRRSIGSAYHAKEKSRYGVVFPCGNLHPSKPLTSLFFGLFRLRRRNKKLSVFRSAVSASIIRKPLLKAPSPNLWNASEQVALRFSLCPC